jgi:ATP-dependent DNA helicase DinG
LAAVDETTDTPPERRVRYVFDEGHHLFDAADSGFAAFISGAEMADCGAGSAARKDARAAACPGLQER